jgi:ribonuclease J
MNSLKIIPLGGMGHVTKNLFLYEYKDSRIIIDCGIGFPEADMFGVDFLIPDISYLKGKEDTVKGIILTHAHDDHLAGLPHVLPHLPPDVPVYGSKLTIGFAQDTVREYKVNARFIPLPSQLFRLGEFEIDSAPVTHSVPGTRHLLIKTPEVTVYHGTDYKIDFTPVDKQYMDLQKIARWGVQGVDLLLIDCLRVEKKGFTPSESNLKEVFEREIEDTKGRFIVTTMSSNIHRIQQAVDVMAAHGRQIGFMGRSIEENVKTATRLDYFSLPNGKMVHKKKIRKTPANRLALIVAGSQGQVDSTLVRISHNKDDRVHLRAGDKIVFSTDVIPGNENAFYDLIDRLSRLGVEISYYDILDDLHVSGHASRGEQELMLSLIKPKNIVPIGGTFRHMVHYKKMTETLGYNPDNVFLMEDGQTLGVDRNRVFMGPEIRLKTIIVDGLGVGDVGKIVLSDRKKMADDGIVVIALTIDQKTGKMLADPEIITRGFVYVRKSQEFIRSLQKEVWQVLPADKAVKNMGQIKEDILKHIDQYIYHETERSPMIIPVIIKV